MALQVVQWDTEKKSFKAGGSSPDFRAGTSAVGAGVSSLAVTFSSALSSENFVVIPAWINTVDGFPQQQPIVITSFGVNGFTASWNAPTDSDKYRINWLVMQQG